MDEPPPVLPPEWVDRTFVDMHLLAEVDRRLPLPVGGWTQGATPPRGPSFLVVDGYLTRSTLGRPATTPLLDIFKPVLESAKPGVPVHGFSYKRPHIHYVKAHTQIKPHLSGGKKFFPYRPQSGSEVIYVSYSLGALVTTLGFEPVLADRSLSSEELVTRCGQVLEVL